MAGYKSGTRISRNGNFAILKDSEVVIALTPEGKGFLENCPEEDETRIKTYLNQAYEAMVENWPKPERPKFDNPLATEVLDFLWSK